MLSMGVITDVSMWLCNVCVQKEELKAELESRLAVKTEECEALTTDLERANHRLSEIDGQTATIAEKVGHQADVICALLH